VQTSPKFRSVFALIALVGAMLCFTVNPAIAGAALTGPIYPVPGGTGSGHGGDVCAATATTGGSSTGVTWTFGGGTPTNKTDCPASTTAPKDFDTNRFKRLYWGSNSSAGKRPQVSMDGTAETLSFLPGESKLDQGKVVWGGATNMTWCDPPNCDTFATSSVDTRIQVTITQVGSGTPPPVPLAEPASVGISSVEVGGVVAVTPTLRKFRANIKVLARFTGDTVLQPAEEFYNAHNHPLGSALVSHFNGAFWYENKPPNASIEFDPSLQTTGTAITFTGKSSDDDGSVKTIEWDFNNDGKYDESKGPIAQWTFAHSGSFPVHFRVTDNEDKDAGVIPAPPAGVTVATKVLTIVDKPAPPPGTGPPAGPPAGPSLIPSTVTNNWLAFPKYTKATSLSVGNLLAGTTVDVTCKTKSKKKQKKGCPYKSKRFTTSGARASLNLIKPFRKKKLPIGTKITITVTVPAQIGKRFTYTTRRGKLPKKSLACLPPGGGTSACA
jgi:hypothetical protein